jgi:hypothetical protein
VAAVAALSNTPSALGGVLQRVAATARALVVFDLDGTLIDNRPRTLSIFESIALTWKAKGLPEAALLDRAGSSKLPFSIEASLRQLGVEDPSLRAEALHQWRREFFSNRRLHHDTCVPGAREFVAECHRRRARLAYLTARDAPTMRAGTLRSLARLGFPLDSSVTLLMKRHPGVTDSAHKQLELPRLMRKGPVVAFFDNEPGHCNNALRQCSEASVVLVDTGHHPDAPTLLAGIARVAHFQEAFDASF